MSALPIAPSESFKKANPHLYPGSVITATPVEDEPLLPVSEATLQHQIANWITCHSGIDPAPLVLAQRMDKRASLPVGSPDLFCFLPPRVGSVEPRCVIFEVKTRTGKVSEAQKRMHADLGRCGHQVFVVRSLDDVIAVISAINKP